MAIIKILYYKLLLLAAFFLATITVLSNSAPAMALSWTELQTELATRSQIPIEQLRISQNNSLIIKEIADSYDLYLIYYNFSPNKSQIVAKINDGNKRKLYLTFDILDNAPNLSEENNINNNSEPSKRSFLIRKGQKINIIYQKGNLSIETEGNTLEAAYKAGEVVKVKLRQGNKVVSATVLDADNAQIVQQNN